MRIQESRSVIYPVFMECSRRVTDLFWKRLYLDLSESKCPKCIFISNNIIYSVNKKKPFSFSIPTKENTYQNDIDNLIETLHELLTTNTTICSNKDNEQKKNLMIAKKKTAHNILTNNQSWSSIRKKNEKEMHIVNYVLRMRENHELDWNTTKYLLQTINIGMLYKTLTSKDVQFIDGNIQSINGIEYNEDIDSFENVYLKNEIKESYGLCSDAKNTKISDCWKKYLITTSSSL